MNKLGFMVTCYDEVNAIDIALTSLRHHYLTETVFIFCEGDESSFFYLKRKHNATICKVCDSQSNILKLSDANYSDDDIESVEFAMREFLFRISFILSQSPEKIDYLVLHCPDTLIRGQINIPEGSGLLGSCVNRYFPEKLNQVLIKHGGIRVEYFGAVPAILNVEDFQKAYEKILNKPTIIRELAEASCYAFSHDILMSILFSLIGKKEEYNPQIVECGRNPNWMETDCPIVHQFRTFYPKRKTKYKSQEDA
jgi:hypothetical protein